MLPSVKILFHSLQHRSCILRHGSNALSTSAVVKRKNYLQVPEDYSDINLPERPKLPMLTKVPTILPHQRIVKMKKSLHLIRGPEEVHNSLLHEQYGIMALTGGRLRFGHTEMMRLKISRKLDTSCAFAIWRIDDPWQPITKRGIGKRHGGGKGPIDHYVTPVKAGRIILEIGGRCSYEEVKPLLEEMAHLLPFKAMAVDQKTLLAMKKLEELKEQRNINPYTYKYLIMNNMCGSQNWVKPIDKLYFGKYV
ncbi:hypothetical protein ONE63_005849 [Megalurothrips usitatus]|uniref:Large ribosomal subunit protein uL16m n=1 Tax=Megalurothrips usitatus TaxID=439358 RepID=A0AAV7XZC5_9NEOP|nr:hypothetical protein ONE63_005849 [Megalurothrips usitatus]